MSLKGEFPDSEIVYVGLGGNQGDRVDFLNRALKGIKANPLISHVYCSSFYQTTPVGPKEQPGFINAVCRFRTSLTLAQLHKELREIETALGKVVKGKYEPRVIDLDILFFGFEHKSKEALTVPHPSWNDRLFVLVPLAEITQEVVVPKERGAIEVIEIAKLLKTFPNRHCETVEFFAKPKY